MRWLPFVVGGALCWFVGFIVGVAVAVARASEERRDRQRWEAKVRRAASVVRRGDS